MARGLPRQDVSEAEKVANDKEWFKQYIDAVIIRQNFARQRRIAFAQEMYNSYNGLVERTKFIQYNNTYGPDKTNIAQYIDYRLCRGNLDLLVGEELESPINGTVYTTNPDAHVRKLEHASTIVGLHVAKPVIDNLREKVGVNVFDGMQPPEVPQDKTIFETLAPKSKNEMIMQLIANRQIPDLKLKLKFSENTSDVTLMSECFGKTYLDEDGNVKYRVIAPELAMYEESDRDPFLERTPYIGEMRKMFVHEILSEFKLTKQEADNLESMVGEYNSLGDDFRKCYEMQNGSLLVYVYSLEWKGFETSYLKTTKKADGSVIEANMSAEYYEKNRSKIENEVKAGKYTIEVKYKKVIYGADRIGHMIYKNLGKVNNIPYSFSNPSWTEFHYTGLLFNTKGGVRISIKQLTEHIDMTYNMVMFQIRRELAKAKGRVMVYDLALLPKKGGRTSTPKEVMYDVTNDGVMYVNTSADGNASGRDAISASGFSSIDMGVSNTISILIPLKENLERMADRITGINPNRRGEIAASATNANTDNAIARSATSTAALTYYLYQYKETVIRRVLDMSKISVLAMPEKWEMILGTEAMQYLKITEDFCFDDYGYTLGDSRKEQTIRGIIRGYFQQSINAGTGRIQDAIEFETAETMTEALEVVSKGWKEVQKAQQQDKLLQQQMAQAGQLQLQQGQQQMQRDQGEQTAKEIALRGTVDMAKEQQKASNQHVLQNSQQQQVRKQ